MSAWLKWGLGIAVVLAVAAGVAVAWIGPRFLIGIATYGRQAREGEIRVGDRAPDVAFVDLDGSTSRSLGDRIGPRPLVLVFGSFT